MIEEESLSDKCKAYLEARWEFITKLFQEDQPQQPLDQEYSELKQLIRDCLTSKN
jgi:hypothetical protein